MRLAAGGGRRPGTAGQGPFAALGRAVVHHPWLTILAWVVAAVAVIATSPGLPTTTNESSFLPKSYESIRAANLQDKAFPQVGYVTASAAIIVFSRADGGKLTPADSAKVRSVAASLGARHIHNIVGVTAGPPSPNREVQTALVAMPSNVVNGSSTAAGDAIKVLRADSQPILSLAMPAPPVIIEPDSLGPWLGLIGVVTGVAITTAPIGFRIGAATVLSANQHEHARAVGCHVSSSQPDGLTRFRSEFCRNLRRQCVGNRVSVCSGLSGDGRQIGVVARLGCDLGTSVRKHAAPFSK